ncbi:lytic murein transglycosylase [Mesorhizobium sp. B2-6-1]|nr:lytic murein transglycosylase [Mesorhizobium sp. B2-6-4]TPJ66799.1 lytic murein transglycosylase [Mesorhizobium sp. B2-6-1]TPK01410.1 lytic murein transglycosylase [Mesorhizobium sp. B2-5-12]TPK26764.1 lytic murein transglycosylase [Mesorhizobium sp. B2-5-6]TPK41034.1 lytic murein transglycosylase [Mesorhizobium sp. B2-5-3]TPN02972.1 lytic murein transglycosylase [Mesorhizobium sp. B2-1-5]TPN68969.1 lytic murein transglycosylase [Mesorhizobium sp. B1-1-1]
MSSLSTPLCPAGHLPRKGGDQLLSRPSPATSDAGDVSAPKLPISPLAGEMAGRPEGGGWVLFLGKVAPQETIQ